MHWLLNLCCPFIVLLFPPVLPETVAHEVGTAGLHADHFVSETHSAADHEGPCLSTAGREGEKNRPVDAHPAYSGHAAASWGFYGHQLINRLAVFTLPPEMLPFYKRYIQYLTENAVNPDRRRYAVEGEAERHYIDIDVYGDSAHYYMPRYWDAAVERYTEDTLRAYGIVPWHVYRMKHWLTRAMQEGDVDQILRLSADMGHYIGDAHVPLHTTVNYNGQLTNQKGIHGFWESRLPELFSAEYDFFTGRATYVEKPQLAIWEAVIQAHQALDSVLRFEKQLSLELGEGKKYSYEERNGITMRVYSREFSAAYHDMLQGQVERQMRGSVKMIGNFWYTCWVDAGQPDLWALIDDRLDEALIQQLQEEKVRWEEGEHTLEREGGP